MSVNVVNLVNPTKVDFTYKFEGEEVTIPAGKVVALPEACAYDLSYHLAQRILGPQGVPFFGIEHSDCQAQLMGLAEPTYFKATVKKVEVVPTKTGKLKKVELVVDEDDLVPVTEVVEAELPPEKPLGKTRDEGITLD